ncbi:hypothetical protein NRY95_21000 [Xanthomonas campestris pv. phormiicola]|nr:hypothetical protein [Xanthomonas campestris pv. phormiicola]UYC16127.1 hypothetical protein NRY95_21000 [Xanthomonas campestris pv. phormiicola]
MTSLLLQPISAASAAAAPTSLQRRATVAVARRLCGCVARGVLGMALAAVVLAAPPLSAQASDIRALRQAATGARFSFGHSTYRLIPGAVVRLRAETGLRDRRTTPAADGVVAQIGPYAILLGRDARSPAPAPRDASRQDERLAAAINELTEQTVLVAPKLKLFGTTPAVVEALARRTGGTLVYASAMDGSAVIGYGSVEAAHAALMQLQTARGVTEVALQVIQAFDERN